MAVNFGDILSGAATGALAGGGVASLPGALIGGGAALLGDLFGGDKPQVPAWQDYTDPTISNTAQQLLRKKLGALQANRQRSLNQRNAQLQMEKIQNDPNASRNVGANIATQNQVGLGAEERNVSANLGGQQIDQEAMQRAASLQEANQKLSYDRNQFARQGFQINQTPTAMQSILGSALSQSIGQAIAPKVTSPTDQGVGQGKMPTYNPPSKPQGLFDPNYNPGTGVNYRSLFGGNFNTGFDTQSDVSLGTNPQG